MHKTTQNKQYAERNKTKNIYNNTIQTINTTTQNKDYIEQHKTNNTQNDTNHTIHITIQTFLDNTKLCVKYATRSVRTLFVSLDFIVDLNIVINMSANDGAFKKCISLMRTLYPLCKKGNRYKHKAILMFAYFTHFKMFPLFNWKFYSVYNFRALPLSTSTLYQVGPECIRYIPRIVAQYPRKLTESFRGFTS